MRALVATTLSLLLGACAGPAPTPAVSDAPSPPGKQMRGMYSYMADAGWYTDCLTGTRMPVAQEGDNAALEAAYSKARQMAGAPMLAVVEGRVEDRLPMEGDTKRPTLIVESSSRSNRRVVRVRNPPRNSKTPTGSS